MISIGIDVSKGKSMVCMLKPGGEFIKVPFEISHTEKSIANLTEIIESCDEEVRVVLEDTGHYHLPIVVSLVEKGIFVTTVNALRMKKYCSQSIRKAKTDKIDSIKIASYGITYWNELSPVTPTDEVYRELKLLSRQYYQMTAMLVKAKVDLGNLLDQTMPEINKLLEDKGEGHRLTDFVKKYYHYHTIVNMGEKKFTTSFMKWAKKEGYRVNEHLSKEIFDKAQNGIPVLPNTLSTKIVITEVVRVLQSVEASRKTILAQMNELAKTLPEYSLVRSMPCIGEAYAPNIIAEIGDVRRFKNKHSLIAYAGIDSPPYESGMFKAKERHISKRGNKYLRKTGFGIMQSLVMHKPKNSEVYDFIQKKRLEGKPTNLALVAGFNKFLRIYYGTMKKMYKDLEQK